jgi:hypothetical protein
LRIKDRGKRAEEEEERIKEETKKKKKKEVVMMGWESCRVSFEEFVI